MHTHTMHNLWRLGVVAMADPIANYFRVENACAPNIKTYVTFIAVVGRAPPTHPPHYDSVRLDDTPTTPTLINSATLGVSCNNDGTIRKRRRRRKRPVRRSSSYVFSASNCYVFSVVC